MNFCPQCGTKFEPEARFCQECGFDINSVIAIDELIPKPIVQPQVVETIEPTPLLPEIYPASPEPVRFSLDEISQPVEPGEPIKLRKKKILWPWILLVLCILVAAGWFGYKMYFHSGKDMTVNFGENIITSQNTSAQKDEANSKAMSLMDQELAKQKEQKQPDKSKNSDQAGNGSTSKTDVDIVSKIILEVGHKETPNNKNPKSATKLTLKKPTMITRITTDHYNDGMGTPRGGKIIIKDRDEKVIGSYKALGMTGKNGTPSARWIVEPNIMLEKGTYFISDTDPSTWSKTFVGGNGFVVVEGYEVE